MLAQEAGPAGVPAELYLALAPCLPGEFNQVVLNLLVNIRLPIDSVLNLEMSDAGQETSSVRR